MLLRCRSVLPVVLQHRWSCLAIGAGQRLTLEQHGLATGSRWLAIEFALQNVSNRQKRPFRGFLNQNIAAEFFRVQRNCKQSCVWAAGQIKCNVFVSQIIIIIKVPVSCPRASWSVSSTTVPLTAAENTIRSISDTTTYRKFRCISTDSNSTVASFSNVTAFNDYYVHSFVCRNLKKWYHY